MKLRFVTHTCGKMGFRLVNALILELGKKLDRKRNT